MSTKEVVALLRANTGARRISQVFDDFVEIFALALRNAVDHRGRQEREEQYLQVIQPYSRDELDRFARAFSLVVVEMEREPQDILGRLYMGLELGNSSMGQFFTPHDIARLIAELNLPGMTEQVQRRGYAELYEPACGAGAFIIATAQAMRQAGMNPQEVLHVTAEDLSVQAVHMIYIHLTLLHIPAVIHRKNTLTQEHYDTWTTAAHLLGGWSWRLRRREPVQTGPKLRLVDAIYPDDSPHLAGRKSA